MRNRHKSMNSPDNKIYNASVNPEVQSLNL